MNVILCIDDNFGMLFGGRRQSRDKAVIEDIFRTVGDNKLYILPFSATLFADTIDKIHITNDISNEIENDDFCFIEEPLDIPDKKINKLIIYKWNRRYPADQFLDKNIVLGKSPGAVYNFKGNSHDKITKEVYDI